MLDDSDLADLPLPGVKAIEVLGFLPSDQIAPNALDRSYFLGVEGAGARPYRLLRDAMKQSGQVGVARMALRGPERLVVLRVREEVIVAQKLLWPDEVRSADSLVASAPEPRVVTAKLAGQEPPHAPVVLRRSDRTQQAPELSSGGLLLRTMVRGRFSVCDSQCGVLVVPGPSGRFDQRLETVWESSRRLGTGPPCTARWHREDRQELRLSKAA
ncbi:hypothetical protein HEP86_02825 [Streptomyces sp. RPA4-5]|nr:hypothetical protein HEP86_02825 [Streptomyces sp. RPA4-5]